MQKIVIIGASGQGKNIALLLEQVGSYDIIGFVDDDHLKKGSIVKGYPVMGSFAEVFSSLYNIADNVAVAFSIGNSDVVERMVRQLKSMEKGIFFPNIVHASVQIDANGVRLGEGNIFNAYCVVAADITIGNFNHFNRCCSISHDTTIGDYNFVHAGVHPCGGLRMGSKNWLGVGSVVIQGVKIGKNTTIGAGAVVLKDVEDNAVMVGNPAKVLKYKEITAGQQDCSNSSCEVKRDVRTIVVGILHHSVKSFFPDYIQSINKQTTKQFELFLFDNHSGFEIGTCIVPVRIIPVDQDSAGIIDVRRLMLDVLKKEKDVENIIFTDTDDFFDEKRVEVLSEGLKNNDIVFTDMEAVDREGKLLNKNFIPANIGQVRFVDEVEKHLLGFGHSAVRWELLKKVWPYADNLIVGDWWFFFSLLAQGHVARKVEGTRYFYRQHGNNLVGMKQHFSSEDIFRAIEVKLTLYSNVVTYLSGKNKDLVEEQLESILRLKGRLSNPPTLKRYEERINSLGRQWCWWAWADEGYL